MGFFLTELGQLDLGITYLDPLKKQILTWLGCTY